MVLIRYCIICMTMQHTIWIYADVIWCHLVLSTSVPMQDLKNFVCLEFWFKHAVGGRAHRSLHLQCPFDFPPTHSKRIRSHPGRRMMHNAVQWQWYAMRKWWHAICETSCKAATLNNSQPMPNLSFSPVNARRKRKVRFRCSALHFTHVVCKNQPNKLFEVMVRCATYLGDVWIYHTYMNTHMLYHFMPEDIPGIMWFCPGSLKP